MHKLITVYQIPGSDPPRWLVEGQLGSGFSSPGEAYADVFDPDNPPIWACCHIYRYSTAAGRAQLDNI